jgi:hypothetical protein
MKSLRQYIKLVEAIQNTPDGWVANIIINYSFPDNFPIPQRMRQIEEEFNFTLESYGFFETGSGGGFGERDISYALEGDNLSEVLQLAKQAVAAVEEFATGIRKNLPKITKGMQISVSGNITDSDYEYDFTFDEAEKIVQQSQQIGKK